ncbi:MAG: type II secretion system F family protein [Planctomycetes bacterium]|nr:type II secretion system F family protein [Planctomycetota bacterium]
MMYTALLPILAQSDELFVYILPLLGSVLLSYGIFQAVSDARSSTRKKMQSRLRGEKKDQDPKLEASILRRGALRETKTIAEELLGKMSVVPKLQTLLDQADLSWSAAQTLVNISGVSLVFAIGLMLLQFNPIVALGCAGAAFILPFFWLNFRRGRRMTKLTEQLPDVFELMSQALRAGHSLPGAIQLIYEQMPPPIATEFAQVYHEQNLGMKMEDALQAMSRRVDSLDIKFFVTAVMIQRQTGGDLAEILDNITGVIRERIELAGLIKGLTAEGRLSGWVLFALPSLIFGATLYLNPDYANVLLEDPIGQIMLGVAAGMQLMGIAMIRWIVNIKV